MSAISKLHTMITKLNRIGTTMALIELNRNYEEISPKDFDRVQEQTARVYETNWSTARQEYWEDVLRCVNRFWWEGFRKSDAVLKFTIAAPAIAQLFLNTSLRNAWITVALQYIEDHSLGKCRIYEKVGDGTHLVIELDGEEFVVAPDGVIKYELGVDIGKDITADFYFGPYLKEEIDAEAFYDSRIHRSDYYYRALAVSFGKIEHLDEDPIEDPTLSELRQRHSAIEALLMARNPKHKTQFYAGGVSHTWHSLLTANFGGRKAVDNLVVNSVPLDIPNHQFITSHAVSELARKLHVKGCAFGGLFYPELAATVGTMAVQVVTDVSRQNLPVLRYSESFTDDAARLIYELKNGLTDLSEFIETCSEQNRVLIRDAAAILTVVYKTQVR